MIEVDNPVENIRDNLRYVASLHRQDDRESVWGRNRIVSDVVRNEITSPEEVKVLCEKLRSKSKVTREDLSALKQALFHDEDNIAMFFSVDGALYALIRELSGRDAMRQLEAACCCCNLALGNSKLTLRLTKAAAPYLEAHLDGLSPVFVDVCAWAIGNLASGGGACWRVLCSQGVLDKLLRLLSSADEKLSSTLVYSLTHYVSAGLDMMAPEELVEIAVQSHHLLDRQASSYWLMFLLSFPSASASVLVGNHVVARSCGLLSDLARGGGGGLDQQLSRETALVRTVGNLVAGTDGSGAMELLSSPIALEAVTSLLATTPHPHLRKECVWVLANVWGHPCEAVRFACGAHRDVEQALVNTFANG